MDVGSYDVLGQYRNISSKLKKRFLRKPNVAEASEQYNSLAKQLHNKEIPHYAGFCCLAVARCEHTLGNPSAEAQALVHGARLFLDAEQKNHEVRCPSFNEHLNAAISCYNHAIKVYMEQDQMTLAAALCLELGKALRLLGQPAEAIPHVQKAADLQNQSTLDYLNALELVGSCKMETADYDGALSTLTEMYTIADRKSFSGNGGRIVGVFSDILARCEVTRVLLLLLLQPTPQRLQAEHVQTLEKYAWESSDPSATVSYLNEDCFLLLQSVVMACQSHDIEALKVLQKDLWLVYIPTFIYGHELWVMNKKIRSRMQVVEMSLLRKVTGLLLLDRAIDYLRTAGLTS